LNRQKNKDLPHVTIYTDGACTGNPGPGGYGAVLLYDHHRHEISEGFRRTTNNRMELMAIISALELLKSPCQVMLYTDSQYISDSINKGWVYRWKKNGWKRSPREKALNIDLWIRILQLFEKHRVRIEWLRGHAGNRENEKADQLATSAIKKKTLRIDHHYESGKISS
jgi:ribonuclease HI